MAAEVILWTKGRNFVSNNQKSVPQ